ncbi:MAG: hypothetical protein Q9225_005420 [Loekoesia sp. 1 TL-2023]
MSHNADHASLQTLTTEQLRDKILDLQDELGDVKQANEAHVAAQAAQIKALRKEAREKARANPETSITQELEQAQLRIQALEREQCELLAKTASYEDRLATTAQIALNLCHALTGAWDARISEEQDHVPSGQVGATIQDPTPPRYRPQFYGASTDKPSSVTYSQNHPLVPQFEGLTSQANSSPVDGPHTLPTGTRRYLIPQKREFRRM